MDKGDKKKVVRNMNESIKILSDGDFVFDLKHWKTGDVIGVLRRCAFEIEGKENIWTEDMTDYQKVEKAIEMGFDVETKYPNGLMVEYLGYHFWGFTDSELASLRQLVRQRREYPV